MARAPRSRDAGTKAKIQAGSDLKQRKTKLAILRTFLVVAFTVTSVASPEVGLAAAASCGAFDETHASRTRTHAPRTSASPRRPAADELKAFAAELVDTRLRKFKTTRKGKAMLKDINAQDAVYAVISLFFARLEDECARNVFLKTRSAESFETLENLLRLDPEAAKRAEEAYTKKTLGVYYYEVPFFKPSDNIVDFYLTYRSDHIEYDTTKFGHSFIEKCRGKWDAGLAARVRYVGKRASKQNPVIERGVEHFYDGRSNSGARFFSPAARLVPKLYNECDAEPRDARGVTAALLLDDHDVRELAKTLKMEPNIACEFAETVMMALLRTRCCDEGGGCGTNIDDGFVAFKKRAGRAAKRTFDHVLEVLKANPGGMTYEDIAKAIGGGTKPDAIRKQVTNKKQNRKSMFMFGKIGKQNLVHLAHLAL